ncbi:MAG: XRE family transcriptional regulator [Ralstonia sp.]|uniref:XRE family transcriptional regulator n=1 Tax=Ralstonia pickettii TaxID=329 RepID=A0AAW4PZ67_RALPI|nr:XRE family transcriptional regulator [Ralstonia pickettii]MBX3752912.1 XRE family transcriptional regulator [Ralstonia pickettii]MBX3765868.1 XRE family transcriptional regulator [Ralstonia pickettii]MBX3776770.1 XRE family transcriptional regulator [Ralstonia pickettii]MBX3781693.1 XRE family transcriptional regulator [Ralstonia pickettii]MBX3787127.1 XRE family transcriptional regulator [Ralstonia pickettii]
MASSAKAATQPHSIDEAPAQLNHQEVGARIREARKARGLTLQELSERSGVALSTISKAERGDIALTYEKFAGLAQALGLEFEQLLGRRRTPDAGPLRPTFTPSGGQVIYDTPNYEYGMLADALTGKRMLPMRAHIRARSVEDFPDYIRHPGEEFVFVLGGEIELRFENGDAFRLTPGDSLYFDSAVGHVYLSVSEEPAEILACCTGTDVRELGDVI